MQSAERSMYHVHRVKKHVFQVRQFWSNSVACMSFETSPDECENNILLHVRLFRLHHSLPAYDRTKSPNSPRRHVQEQWADGADCNCLNLNCVQV